MLEPPQTAVPERVAPAGKSRKRLGLGVLLAAIAAIVTAAGNVEAFAGLLGRIAPAASEVTIAAINKWPRARDHTASGLVDELFQQPICEPIAVPIDMDGNGLAADLAVFFSSTRSDSGQCLAETDGEKEVAFFHWTTTKYLYVGNPPKRGDDIASWAFVGPALLRQLANSDTPPIEVYVLSAKGQLSHVGDVQTYNDAEEVWSRTKAIQSGAWIQVPTGIWEVTRSSTGHGSLKQLSLTDIMEVDGHSRRLSFNQGSLIFDGEQVEIERTKRARTAPPTKSKADKLAALFDEDEVVADSTATVSVGPLDRIYIEGCEPQAGLSLHPNIFAAYRIDPVKGGSVFCGVNEDGDGVTVAIHMHS